MQIRDRRRVHAPRQFFGQLGPGAITAATPEAISPADDDGVLSISTPAGLGYYKLAVMAGVSVWLLTKVLDGAFFGKER